MSSADAEPSYGKPLALARDFADDALVVFLIRCPEEPYKLTEEDVVLFRHPKVNYLRLSGVDFAVFEKSRTSVMRHEKLSELNIEMAKYTAKAFHRLFIPSIRLTKLTLFESRSLPQQYGIYSALLTYTAPTLKSLTLFLMGDYRYHVGEEEKSAMVFSSFKALRFLAIDSRYILGRPFPTHRDHESREAAQLIARRLPPNIKVLMLEGLVSPYPGPINSANSVMSEVFPKEGEVLIQVLIEQKKTLVPGLKRLWVDCGHGDTYISDWLCEMGDKFDIIVGVVNGFEISEQGTPTIEWLDEP